MRNKPETRITDTGKEYQDQLPASIRRVFENQPQENPDEMDTAAYMRWILETSEPKRPRGDSEAEQKAWDEEQLRRMRLLGGLPTKDSEYIFENQPQENPDEMDTAAYMRWILETSEPKRPRGDSEAEQKAWDEEQLRRMRLIGELTHHTDSEYTLGETIYGLEAYLQERGVVPPRQVKGDIIARLYGFACRRGDMRWILETSAPKRPCGDSEADQKAWCEELLRRLLATSGRRPIGLHKR